jgi:hypothetical protein
MAQVYLRVCTLLLLALLAGGCGGDSSSEPKKTEEASGLAHYEVPGETFSIGVPSSWSAMSAKQVFKGESLDSFTSDNPELRGLIDSLTQPNSVMKFIAFNPTLEQDFATSTNVVVEPLPSEMTLDGYVQAALAQLHQVPFVVGEIDHEPVAVPAGQAEKISYRSRFTFAGGKRTVATLQYALVQGGNAYIVTYTTLPELTGKYADTFEQSVNAFRIKGS